MIPVSDLMQVQHPGYRTFIQSNNMSAIHYPLFFDYCICVSERFRHYAYQEANVLINENSLMHIIDCIKQLDDTDEPEIVLPLREQIRHSCYEFLEHCNDMSTKFKSPTSISLFYNELGQLVMQTAFEFAGVQHD
jgi:hypothetical protein